MASISCAPFFTALEDHAFAPAAVGREATHITRGLAHRAPMARPIDGMIEGQKMLQRSHVIGHRAVGRRDDRGRPGHHVIARQKRILLLEREGEMIGRMAGRGDGRKRPARTGDRVAFPHEKIRHVLAVASGIEPVLASAALRPRRPVRSATDDRRAGRLLQRACRGRMVAMRVRHHDMAHRLAAHRVEQRGEMGLLAGRDPDRRSPPRHARRCSCRCR